MKRAAMDAVVNDLMDRCHEALADLRYFDDDKYYGTLCGYARSISVISIYDKKYEPQAQIARCLNREGIYYKKIDAFLEDYDPRFQS